MTSSPATTPSPGEAFSSGPPEPPMRAPHLELIYRAVAAMKPAGAPGRSAIPDVAGTGVTRVVLPIEGGTVRGPRIRGEIVADSGADWAERVNPSSSSSTAKPFTRLNARYTLRTDDGHFILVTAAGSVVAGPDAATGPGAALDEAVRARELTQDGFEYFTHIRFEASGAGPYAWMNSVVAVGVMATVQGRAVIDCYRLTNFPGRGTEHL